MAATRLLVASRKGAFFLTADKSRKSWKLSRPMFLGHVVHHIVLDPRDRKTMLAAARTGHLGPTIFRSVDRGKSFSEADQPPAFDKDPSNEHAPAVDHVFWLTPGHSSQPGVWYAGSSPQGLFRSEDGGQTWQGVAGFNAHPKRFEWTGSAQDGTPDGPKLHSIQIDPRDPNHLYVGMSSGGVFESTDRGADWRPLNKGCEADFIPTPDPEFGHDPHNMQMHPAQPDVLYQQNHCGIYRMDRADAEWVRIGRNMPKKVGDIGFPIVLDPRDPNQVWVFPMDGTSVWPRTSPGGKPAVYTTRNAGKSWKRLDKGLPKSNAHLTVKRQAMARDEAAPLGLYFGTTSGEIWGSRNEGKSWEVSGAPPSRDLLDRDGRRQLGVMQVFIPGPLRSYTHGASSVEARGRTLDELLITLDGAFPGIRFRIVDEQDRIRQHIKIFVNAEQQESVSVVLGDAKEIHIICALSGG